MNSSTHELKPPSEFHSEENPSNFEQSRQLKIQNPQNVSSTNMNFLLQKDEKVKDQYLQQNLENYYNEIHQITKYKKSHNRSRSRSKSKEKLKYCCDKCSQASSNHNRCVCVIPAHVRKKTLGLNGCHICGCKGCGENYSISSIQQEKKEYKNDYTTEQLKNSISIVNPQDKNTFDLNGACCPECTAMYSKAGKSCPCQIPLSRRKKNLEDFGCRICGCHGCTQEDRDAVCNEPNMYNISSALFTRYINEKYQIQPIVIGFGIPDRTSTYILNQQYKNT